MSAKLGEVEVDKVLCFSPHPDDTEIMCGATVAMLAAQGVEVILCVATNGACGSNDPAVDREQLIATRQQEQRNAAVIMGVSDVVFLGHEDGFLQDSHALRIDIIRQIRQFKPDAVIGPDPSLYYVGQWYVNHPDHRRLGEAILAAINPGISTIPLYRSALYDQGFEPHTLKACLLTASPNSDLFLDIEDFFQVKVAALDAHVSQRQGWGVSEEAVKALATMSAALGKVTYPYAEAFKALYFRLPEPPENLMSASSGTDLQRRL
ncbi:MAG: PIG-L deacetylase family protein [Actinomycetota bacterium]